MYEVKHKHVSMILSLCSTLVGKSVKNYIQNAFTKSNHVSNHQFKGIGYTISQNINCIICNSWQEQTCLMVRLNGIRLFFNSSHIMLHNFNILKSRKNHFYVATTTFWSIWGANVMPKATLFFSKRFQIFKKFYIFRVLVTWAEVNKLVGKFIVNTSLVQHVHKEIVEILKEGTDLHF